MSHKLFRTEAHTARLLTYLLSIVDSFPGQFLVEKLVGVVEDECFKKNMMLNAPRKTDVNSYTVFENL